MLSNIFMYLKNPVRSGGPGSLMKYKDKSMVVSHFFSRRHRGCRCFEIHKQLFILCILMVTLPLLTTTFFAGDGEVVEQESIRFFPPAWSNKSYAVVSLEFTYIPDAIYAKMESDREWINITTDRNFKVTENGLLYVRTITDEKEVVISEYIECFDRLTPEISYVINDRVITLSAKDSQSGVAAIYVNGTKLTQFSDGSTENIAVTDYTITNKDQSIMLYAEDKAGNVSKTYTININSSGATGNSSSNSNSSITGAIGNANISMKAPEWTNKESVLVKVEVKGNNIDIVEAKTSRNSTWRDITSSMDLKIQENTDVYIRTTDTNDSITTVSQRIDCFDRIAPTVTMEQDGLTVNVLARDSDSGVQTIYINGKPYNSDSASISVDENKTFTAQAIDHAGNLSDKVTLKAKYINPLLESENNTIGTTYNNKSNIDSGPIDTDDIQAGEIYYFTLGDGTSYTLEELQELDVPIYIIPGVDEQYLKAIIDAQLDTAIQADDPHIVTYEMPPEDMQEIDENLEVSEMALSRAEDAVAQVEETVAQKKKTTTTGIILIGIIFIALGAVVFFYFKRHNAKFAKDDIYENEYDPNRNAYEDDYDDGYEDDANNLEYDVSY